MTALECYEKIKIKKPGMFLKSCLDFGSFYLFILQPIDTLDRTFYTGTMFDAIDKETGRIFEYDIASDIEKYKKAKPVKINTVLDETI